MSKELESLKNIIKTMTVLKLRANNKDECNYLEEMRKIGTSTQFQIIKKALQRLEQIDNSDIGEALQKLKENAEMFDEIAKENNHSYKDNTVIEALMYHSNNFSIEQALIKAQEQEKVLDIIKKKDVKTHLIKRYNNVNNYNECMFFGSTYLTQEEFELLKRYLENGQ